VLSFLLATLFSQDCKGRCYYTDIEESVQDQGSRLRCESWQVLQYLVMVLKLLLLF